MTRVYQLDCNLVKNKNGLHYDCGTHTCGTTKCGTDAFQGLQIEGIEVSSPEINVEPKLSIYTTTGLGVSFWGISGQTPMDCNFKEYGESHKRGILICTLLDEP